MLRVLRGRESLKHSMAIQLISQDLRCINNRIRQMSDDLVWMKPTLAASALVKPEIVVHVASVRQEPLKKEHVSFVGTYETPPEVLVDLETRVSWATRPYRYGTSPQHVRQCDTGIIDYNNPCLNPVTEVFHAYDPNLEEDPGYFFLDPERKITVLESVDSSSENIKKEQKLVEKLVSLTTDDKSINTMNSDSESDEECEELEDYSKITISNLSEDPTLRLVQVMKAHSDIRGTEVCSGRRKRGPSRKKGGGRKRRGKKRSTTSMLRPPGMVVMKSALMADCLEVNLRTTDIRVLQGGTAVSERWNPNAAYQPLVGGPTGTIPSYSTYALLYGFYRVIRYTYVVEFTNMEAFPVAVYVLNLNNDAGTSAAFELASNANSSFKILSAKGGKDQATLRGSFTIARILGSQAPLLDSDYRSLNNNTPADVTWLQYCAQSTIGTSLTNGVAYVSRLSMVTQWFDRLQQ